MSGICGIFNRDGAPCDPGILAAMLAATDYRGPHGVHTWARGPIALGHQLMATTPGSLIDTQPLHDQDSEVVISFDGRIDNRPELIDRLRGRGSISADISDAALVLRAYECWQETCCLHLIGDFAFAIWDGRRRTLFAARDPFGIKPFHYFVNQRCFAFGSESAQVLYHPAVSRDVNEGMVAECLAGAITSQDETLFADIRRLPPGHRLSVESERFSVRHYWDPAPDDRIRYRGFDEYLDHFLELLWRAVADRMRCIGPPGLLLSGGLDSSAIAGVAQTILARQDHKARLATFSRTLPGLMDDEAPYIDCIVRKWGLASHCLPYRFPDHSNYTELVGQTQDLPDYPNTSMRYPLCTAAADRGIHVLLSGVGAELWLTGSATPYLDMLTRLSLGAAIKELVFQQSRYGPRYALTQLARSLAWPMLPGTLRAKVERSRSRLSRLPTHFLTPSFARKIGLEERFHRYDSAWRFPNLAVWEHYRNASCGYMTHNMEQVERGEARHQIESRHPFLDRRLAEFLAAVPDDVKRRTRYHKLLLRHSDLHPQRIAWRLDNSNYGVAFEDALKSDRVSRTLSSLRIAENGWVGSKQVTTAYDQFLGGSNEAPNRRSTLRWSLWMVFAIEIWYRVSVVGDTD